MPYGSDYLFCNSAGTWKVPIVKVHAKNENEAWRVIVRTFYPEYTNVPLAEIKTELGHNIYLVTPQEQVTFYALPEDNVEKSFTVKVYADGKRVDTRVVKAKDAEEAQEKVASMMPRKGFGKVLDYETVLT